jgi:hypothetical protein
MAGAIAFDTTWTHLEGGKPMATSTGRVLSVNVGTVREFEYAGRPARSGLHRVCEMVGILMRFTIPLLAIHCIANAARSADPGAEEPGTLAQEYQRALKESGQVSPSFREAKTDEERKKAVEATGQFARRYVKLAEKYPNDPLALEVLTQAVRAMNLLDSAIQMCWQTNKTAFPIRSKDNSTKLAMALLLRDHIRSDKLGVVCERMRYGTRKEYATFLHQVVMESPHHEVRGLACLSLAQFLYSHRRFSSLGVAADFAHLRPAFFPSSYSSIAAFSLAALSLSTTSSLTRFSSRTAESLALIPFSKKVRRPAPGTPRPVRAGGPPGSPSSLTLSPRTFSPTNFLFGAVPEFIGSAYGKTRVLCE